MLTEGGLVMTRCSTVASPAPGTAIQDQQAPLLLDDPPVATLIAEVDAILCAAAEALLRRPPAPPVVGCALLGPRSPGRSWQIPARPRTGPVRDVFAVERGPPQPIPDGTVNATIQERRVMASPTR